MHRDSIDGQVDIVFRVMMRVQVRGMRGCISILCAEVLSIDSLGTYC